MLVIILLSILPKVPIRGFKNLPFYKWYSFELNIFSYVKIVLLHQSMILHTNIMLSIFLWRAIYQLNKIPGSLFQRKLVISDVSSNTNLPT